MPEGGETNMRRKGQMNAMLALSIGLILGVVILGVVFSFISDQTSTSTITADQFTASNESCVQVTSNCITTLTNVYNATTPGPIEAGGNYSICTVGGALSGLYLNPADSQGNIDNNGYTANATYNERSCGFITSGTTRTLVTLIPLLLAIVALVFVTGFLVLKR